ncbi:MAG TPA: ribonuclease HII [Saprospiraceae bacterium]|nr:ribonuclease HII [Saprospiraceae bacterium]
MSLRTYYKNKLYEAGCDEAGRGPLAGPVYAAAVILDPSKPIKGLQDSKKLPEKTRLELRLEIEEKALAWAVQSVDPREIDRINILQASLKAMKLCLDQLSVRPVSVLVDGNRKIPYLDIPQYCMVKGDASFQSIAAASILAKTYRDACMLELHEAFPQYEWNRNKGYPTVRHQEAIIRFGYCVHHRRSFVLKRLQTESLL